MCCRFIETPPPLLSSVKKHTPGPRSVTPCHLRSCTTTTTVGLLNGASKQGSAHLRPSQCQNVTSFPALKRMNGLSLAALRPCSEAAEWGWFWNSTAARMVCKHYDELTAEGFFLSSTPWQGNSWPSMSVLCKLVIKHQNRTGALFTLDPEHSLCVLTVTRKRLAS